MELDFNKGNGLIPVVIQNEFTLNVLMLGYMNSEALHKTIKDKKVTFYSRSKKRLWTKGETSGHYLFVKSIVNDCDSDALLIKVNPIGPTCHTGSSSCFKTDDSHNFIYKLESIISQRIYSDSSESYTKSLFEKGLNKVAQKVGEEAVEVVIEAKDNNEELFLNETADLLYHLLILLNKKGVSLSQVEKILQERNQKK